MEARSIAYAQYWRNSLADAELGRGALSVESAKSFSSVPLKELRVGLVPPAVVKACFDGKSEQLATVDVTLRPSVYVARIEHGKRRRNGIPGVVTPLVTPCVLDRNGRLYPSIWTVVPRDLLEPLQQGTYSVGALATLDDVLATEKVPGIEYAPQMNVSVAEAAFQTGWHAYWTGCERLLDKVCERSLAQDDDLLAVDYGYITSESGARDASKHILALYDHLRRDVSAPLFDRYARDSIDAAAECLPPNSGFSARVAHASNVYPLAQAQRDALSHLLAARDGEILAVNGPPGTGKTTLVLSVVASLWAKAAIDGVEPPLILAASSNNQAVLNIIDAFGKDFAVGKDAMAGRWLPKVTSFGAYFASAKAAPLGLYQTQAFFSDVESVDYVENAQAHYLRAAAKAFPRLETRSVQSIVTELNQRLRAEVRKLGAIEGAWSRLTEARNALRKELPGDAGAALSERLRERERAEDLKRACEALSERWQAYLARESLFVSLLTWFPPLARRRLRLARLFLKQGWPAELPQEDWQSVEQVERTLECFVARQDDALRERQASVEWALNVLRTEHQRLQEWKSALELLGRGADRRNGSFVSRYRAFRDRLLAGVLEARGRPLH